MKINKDSATARVLLFIAGVGGATAFTILFDDVLYPIVTYAFGIGIEDLWKGFVVMFLLALFFNYVLVLIYDWIGKDLFGFEGIKKVKMGLSEKENLTKIQRRILWFLKYGEIPLFLFLSWYDPFMATLWKRKSAEFTGFQKKDYWILILSTFLGCFIWSSFWLIIGNVAVWAKGLF